MELNITIKPYLVQSGSTIRNWAENEFIEAQQQIVDQLGTAISRIHISFDLWTFPNGYALCGIVTHFVSHQYSNQSVLLGLK
jgi:hypothetical protein